jgi:hypothetical protein
MIRNIVTGDITDPMINPGDIIIGMNSKLTQASAIGRPFVRNVEVIKQIDLGSVLTFNFEPGRLLHMLICHKIGKGGWASADKFVRFCLDYLWKEHGRRQYGVVQIGTGSIGKRDGADSAAIRTAMTTSFLEMDLFIRPEEEEAATRVTQTPLVPFRTWSMDKGEREIRVHH